MTNCNANSNIGAAELFHMLESNKLKDVEEIKKVFHDHFLATKDSWLVSGLFDYYLSTDSLRAVEVLAGVREPHDKHLFDKLTDTLAAKPSNNGQKIKTLTLLGHVARRQPTWLYRMASHTLLKQLLHLLKVEEDIVLLMSALLLLITLLPMLPTALAPHLNEIFEVFSRLASLYYNRLNISNANPGAFSTTSTGCDVDLHLLVGLHNLFHRLYAMYPCNFISFLKPQYSRDQTMIFKKVISPMLDSVRMHPLLVTMSKETEISSSRWKKMEHHDVVAECSRFALFERSSREEMTSLANMRFTPISVVSEHSCPYTPVSNSEFPMVLEQQSLDNVTSQESFWSPTMLVGANSPPPAASLQATPLSHVDPKSTPSTPGGNAAAAAAAVNANLNNRSRTSPPEAAVEATPETTPIKDLRSSGRHVPTGSAAVRALSAFGANGAAALLGSSSRPSTPTAAATASISNQQHSLVSARLDLDGASILDRKLNRLVAERQNALQHPRPEDLDHPRRSTVGPLHQLNDLVNGKLESWQQQQQQQQQPEDQEVSDIVSATARRLTMGSKDVIRADDERGKQQQQQQQRQTVSELTRKVKLKVLCQNPTPVPRLQRRANSWPDLASGSSSSSSSREVARSSESQPLSRSRIQREAQLRTGTFRPLKTASAETEDTATQTHPLQPYECLMYDLFVPSAATTTRQQQQQQQQQPGTGTSSISTTPAAGALGPTTTTTTPSNLEPVAAASRLSPSDMLERYIHVCATHSDLKSKAKANWPSGNKRINEDGESNGAQHPNDEGSDTATTSNWWSAEMDRANQQIQLMQMQLQFERQRREVHAERNRRLLGKLRDSRALEELNSSMTDRLKRAESEIDSLKNELNHSRHEARSAEQKLFDTVQHWQTKCKEDQQRNAMLKEKIERLEDELKSERNKVNEHEKERRAAEATLFEAAHQLKEALRAANQSEELKRLLDTVQKRFLLLGEAQARIQEKMGAPAHMARQEVAQIQRCWSEEVSTLRRQLDSQTLHLESLKSRLSELEHKDARKEVQLVDQQRLLQEAKEKHAAELEAVESKYKAQLEINLLLEGRILELHGKLEQATACAMGSSLGPVNLASSASPKERSPPLSASLASSSEGSLAFIHSAMNDCCDPAGEIANLQAIVDDISPLGTSHTITTSATANAAVSQSLQLGSSSQR